MPCTENRGKLHQRHQCWLRHAMYREQMPLLRIESKGDPDKANNSSVCSLFTRSATKSVYRKRCHQKMTVTYLRESEGTCPLSTVSTYLTCAKYNSNSLNLQQRATVIIVGCLCPLIA
ncbi:hypothetical protein BRADI_3g20385v3 [Brachypodium distachyon]|uniref:Uncharacterized protein n=1 Tax=Brachypodium distachyon TaxID=15368 RepID=A0A0Q3F8B5_BRADI|nr:hypothetical protein BRADI_3g20385v3 [Brachypodium distachyon]